MKSTINYLLTLLIAGGIHLGLSCDTKGGVRLTTQSTSDNYCHTGTYLLDDGRHLVISPLNESTYRYRFLNGQSGKLFQESGHQYRSGSGWLGEEPNDLIVDFGDCSSNAIRFDLATKSIEGSRVELPYKEVNFSSNGVELYGELFFPKDKKPEAVVVLQFGSGRSSAVQYNFVQRLLPIYNIGVFVFDKRGTGRSSGDFTADFITMAEDQVAAVDKVKKIIDDPNIPIGVMGESQGGWVVPLTATKTEVDFVIVSYGLAISPQEENQTEVLNDLKEKKYGEDVLAKAQEVIEVTDLVLESKFSKGLEDLSRLKDKYSHEEWFKDLGGDYTGVFANASSEELDEFKNIFDYEIDLRYDAAPVLHKVDKPMLWVLAGMDTEAPFESTLDILLDLQKTNSQTDIVVFPNAEHGIIEVEKKEDGLIFLGRHSDGYFDLLRDWILTRELDKQYGNAIQYPR